MTRRPSSGTLAVLLASLAVLAVVAVVSSTGGGNPDDPGSRSAGAAGGLALYTWLDRLGLSDRRISGGFDVNGTDLLLIIRPTTEIDEPDADAVVRMVRGGGDVVLAVDGTDDRLAAELLDRLAVAVDGNASGATLVPAQPVDAAGRVRRVPAGTGALRLSGAEPATPLLLDGAGRTVGLAEAVGAGRAYVFGTGYPFSNLGLEPRRGDSYGLVLTLLERARGGRVAFDEVHHGEAATGVGAALTWPLRIAGGLALLVLLAWRGLSGLRPGRPVPSGDPSRVPSATQFVGAVARLVERSRSRGAVAERYAEELKHRIGVAAGVDPALEDADFVDRIRGFGEDRAEGAAAVLRRARELAADRPTEPALVALAGAVDEQEARWAAGSA